MKPLLICSVLLSAILIFLIQPMLAKAVLPQIGGAAGTWIVSMLVFQLLLLGGYFYAAVSSAFLSPQRQILLHLVLMFVTLGYAIPLELQSPDIVATEQPERWIITTLLYTVGLPYFILSATSSLIQRWYYALYEREPCHLFSASNAGSFLGLFAYPFLVEWLFTLPVQYHFWSIGFALLVGLFVVIALSLFRITRSRPGISQHRQQLRGIPASNVLATIFRAFVPSSLFLSVTLCITTDLASVPLLWIIPLALYLCSFVIVFAPWGDRWISLAQQFHPFALLATLIATMVVASAFWLAIHYVLFFIVALSCHGQLARSRPEPEKLTVYFLWISVGGAFGGLFNTVAPFLFNGVYEYLIVMIFSLMALPAKYSLRQGWAMLQANRTQTLKGGAAILIILALIWGMPQAKNKQLLHMNRNFFGVSKVENVEHFHIFTHGTTLHGVQALREETKLKPLSYYVPLHEALSDFPDSYYSKPFGVLGLGAGTLACYGRSGQEVDFFEIDEAVISIAQNPDYFTYLRDCGPTISIFQGDGRIELRKRPDERYNLLILDAFSSDSVPLHLLSAEAMQEYTQKVDPVTGIIAFNTSNRYINIVTSLTVNAAALGWKPYARWFSKAEDHKYILASEWFLMLPPNSPWEEIIRENDFVPLDVPLDTPGWTDHYSSIIPALKW